jgi:hypothetical protein
MRHGILTIIIVLSIGLLFGSVSAKTEVDISGQVRTRAELDQKSTDPADGTRQYTFLRSRIMARAMISDNTRGVVQFQDSRRLGDNDLSGTLNDGNNVDVHQAYLQVDQLWDGGFGVKAGRFEVALGNQRVFGTVGWHNVGRSWEGIQAFYDFSNVRLDLFWLKNLERDSQIGNADFDTYGAQAKIKSVPLDLFGFFENDALKDTATIDGTPVIADDQNMKRYTFGLYTKQKHERFDFEVNAAYQTGNQRVWDSTALTSDEIDLSGVMFTGEVGYTFDNKRQPRLALGVDYTSGDDDATDDEYKAYNNLYYTGHKFRGYMDYFLGSNAAGLVDVMVRGKVELADGWTLNGDLHLFSTAEDYAYTPAGAEESVMTSDLGTEFDLTLTTNRIAGVKMAAGGGVFMPKDGFDDRTDGDTAGWGWLQLIADF